MVYYSAMARTATKHTALWRAMKDLEYESTEGGHRPRGRRGGLAYPGTLRFVEECGQLGPWIAYLSAALLYDIGIAVRDAVWKVPDAAKRERELSELRRDAQVLRRPLYYERENERRRALAEERRKIRRRTTTAPMPTPEQVLAAWNARKASKENAIRLGGLLQDLECYVDNTLMFGENGSIRGRHGGIRSWLRVCLPELLPRYKTLMRYKAMVIRLRQATGTKDPKPTERLLAEKPRHEVVRAVLEDKRPTFKSIEEVLEVWLGAEPEVVSAPRPKPGGGKLAARRT